MTLFAQTPTPVPVIPDPAGWTEFFNKNGFPAGMAVVLLVCCGYLVYRALRDPYRDRRRLLNLLTVNWSVSDQRHQRLEEACKGMTGILAAIGAKVGATVDRDCQELVHDLDRPVVKPDVIDLDVKNGNG
jgi:hypothetical protein